MNWKLLGTSCGKSETIMKYESIERPGLMKEINILDGKRSIVYYWEDAKPMYKTAEDTISQRIMSHRRSRQASRRHVVGRRRDRGGKLRAMDRQAHGGA